MRNGLSLLRENLFLQFSLVSFMVMAGVAAGLTIVLGGIVREHAIRALAEEARGHVENRVLAHITPADLETPMTGDRYDRFDAFVKESLVSERTARVKLWGNDATTIYSSARESVGARFPDNENLQKALRRETTAVVKSPEEPENEQERSLGTVMEVYTPIIFPGAAEPQGVLEIYQYYEPTARLIEEQRRGIVGWTIAGFLTLYAALATSVWRAWRAIVEQQERRRRAQEEKERMQSQLQQFHKMEAIGRMAGTIAHDFNNLLMPVIGLADLLLSRPLASEETEMVTTIKKSGERAAELTHQLLVFSRGKEVESAMVNLNDVVQGMSKILVALLGKKVRCTLTLAQDLGSVRANRNQLEQVVLNLAANAGEAMPEGGTLTIETRNRWLGDGDCRFRPGTSPGPHINLTVSDTGPGIPPEVVPHIFEPFFTTKKEGTGMGLSTVYSIVTRAGGCVCVDRGVGKGATFEICLPTASYESAPIAVSPAQG